MRMYKCCDCGKTFDMPKVVKECIGEYWGLPYFEEFGYCPYCNSDDFEDITEQEDKK